MIDQEIFCYIDVQFFIRPKKAQRKFMVVVSIVANPGTMLQEYFKYSLWMLYGYFYGDGTFVQG